MQEYRIFARARLLNNAKTHPDWERTFSADTDEEAWTIGLGYFEIHCKGHQLTPDSFWVHVRPCHPPLNSCKDIPNIINASHSEVEEIKKRLLSPPPLIRDTPQRREKSFSILTPHEPTTEEVVHRLNEHYAKLEIFTAVNSTPRTNYPHGGNTAYRLAATDLFVEKAAEYLRARAESYKSLGLIAYVVSAIPVGAGIWFAYKGIDESSNKSPDILAGEIANHLANTYLTNGFTSAPNVALTETTKVASAVASAVAHNDYAWFTASHFAISFTFYGFLVLLAVAAWRFGKAMLDQSERLYEKRHAMRLGRLYAHLKDGELNIDELERAFSWNASQPNAFGNMSTDAKAPWGAVASALPEIIRASKSDKS